MKKLSILVFSTILSLPFFGQEDSSTKWLLSIDYGVQEHDKRFFRFSSLAKRQPKTFGTYQVGVSTARKVFHKNRFELFAGVGLSTELATLLRPFEHHYGEEFQPFDLRFTNRYYQFLAQLPIRSKYMAGERFGFSLDVLPQFNFLTVGDHSEAESYSWWRFGLYSVEVNPGLVYSNSMFDFGLKYRVFQVKTIDRILFGNIIGDPFKGQNFETYNPFKFWLSAGYKF